MSTRRKADPSPAFRRRKSIDARKLGGLRRLVLRADRLLGELGELSRAFAGQLVLRGLGKDTELNARVAAVIAGETSIPAALESLGITVRYPASDRRKPRRGTRVKGQGRRGGR